jgi:hypothetical protein
MVKINVLSSAGVDVVTPSERDAGKVDIGVQKDVGVDIKPSIGINIVNNNLITYEGKLKLRKAINGDIMIFDHNDIDIVILKEQKKVVAFAKEMLTDSVYGAETRLFNFLRQRGVVAYDSIQGGNIYGSMEAKLLTPEAQIKKPLSLTIHMIHEWLLKEKPMQEFMEEHDDMMDDALLDPDEEHATELGEVPHEAEKGSIVQKNMFAPYMYGRYTY